MKRIDNSLDTALKKLDLNTIINEDNNSEIRNRILNDIHQPIVVQKRIRLSLFPRILTVGVFLIGIFYISSLSLSEQAIFDTKNKDVLSNIVETPKESTETNQLVPSINYKQAEGLIGSAFASFTIVLHQEGGGKQAETFEYNGETYRYLGDSFFNSKDALYEYLLNSYTVDIVEKIYTDYKFMMHEGRLAHPHKDDYFFKGRNFLDWQQGTATISQINETEVEVSLEVPYFEKQSDEEAKYTSQVVRLKYVADQGWRVASFLPITLE
ncbi:IseA DL-endopeptidase inhibitor family protein [Bacillus pinisoli]|uniref:IseA DL-endopeptidase inhibitor family protein n=1 Tax=Bacillus pinisoli TaxID=2901866 RepID=UPI001FF1AEE1|nr:IseA DL-endopeptidase inhibitor family protein [Bacillus pinisoli]